MRLTCGNCGNPLEAMATEGSTLIVCPKCSQVVRVPHDGSVHLLAFAETLPLTPPIGEGQAPASSPSDIAAAEILRCAQNDKDAQHDKDAENEAGADDNNAASGREPYARGPAAAPPGDPDATRGAASDTKCPISPASAAA